MGLSAPHSSFLTRWFAALVMLLLLAVTAATAQKESVTVKGKTYEVATNRGMPVGFESDQIRVTNLSFGGSTQYSPEMAFVWLVTAEVRAKGKFTVTVTTPLDERISVRFDCKGPGGITQTFFDSSRYPTLWAWLEEPETTWIPFTFSFQEKDPRKNFEATQWVKFDSATKRQFRDIMKQARNVSNDRGARKPAGEAGPPPKKESADAAPAERIVFDFDGRQWSVGYEVDAGAQRITEFVLPGETVKNWKELVTTQVFPSAQDQKTAQEIVTGLQKVTVGRCPKAMWRIIQQSEDEALYEWQTTKCRGYDDQYEVAKIIRARGGLYRVAYANRKLPISDDLKHRWIGLIQKARVELPAPPA